ncbi:secreted RxLR effector protein 78-like [Rutidosis leptorrhynchoides]|uniref:secreted RxLR effector protein 78-like n=1 Tax=Rutidosis leptorrhynchoides TaxID=125765 RepID=UPI003A99D4C5
MVAVLILNEAVTDLKLRKKKSFFFKVDFSKAFDSVNWMFLLDILDKMGFGARWIKWIKACLSSTSVSILVNGSPTQEFFPQKGIRQGDPLSPFLFILAVEGLNVFTNLAVQRGIIKGVSIGKEEVVISHL